MTIFANYIIYVGQISSGLFGKWFDVEEFESVEGWLEIGVNKV